MSEPLRIGPGGDVVIERDADGVPTLVVGGGGDEARIEGRDLGQGRGRAVLGGWGVTEALRRGARTVVAPGVADGALVAGLGAWRFDWDRIDWDELASAVVAGRILARAAAGTVVELHADGTFVVTPATADLVTAHVLDGLDGPDLIEPDATVRLCTVRLEPAGEGIAVHSVRGLPAPGTALVEQDEPNGFASTVTLAVVGPDPDAIATQVWEAAGGQVEVRFTRRERPDPTTWADTIAELKMNIFTADADEAERVMVDAFAAIRTAGIAGVAPVTDRPPTSRPVWAHRVRAVPSGEVGHVLVIGGDRVVIPPSPTQPPPLPSRRLPAPAALAARPANPGRKVAPSISTHPETIAALRDDLSRRRLSAGPADDDSVHWDAQPSQLAPLGALTRACSGPCPWTPSPSVSVSVWAPSEDAYDWMAWYLDVDRFRAMLPSQAVATVERVELPNLNALAFVVTGSVATPAVLLGEYVRGREVQLPDELYPSSALRTSAT
jgi:hypothetical protein